MALLLGLPCVAGASQPTAFGNLASSLESFTRLKLALTMSYPAKASDCRVWLRADSTQTKVALEWASCASMQYAWDGTNVRYHSLTQQSPELKAELNQIVADLWGEVRSGFDNSTVTEIDPAQVGFSGYARNEWSSVVLPFSWASDYVFYVGVGKISNEATSIVIFKNGVEKDRIRINATHMNPTIPAHELNNTATQGGAPWDPSWRTGLLPLQ